MQERSTGGLRGHVPYRNSTMTMVLRDSLGGNCRTVMIANITAQHEMLDESISTCRFAQRVALVANQVSPPKTTVFADPCSSQSGTSSKLVSVSTAWPI